MPRRDAECTACSARGSKLSSTSDVRVFESEIGIPSFPYLRDHRVQHSAVVPATAWSEMALEAFVDSHGSGPMLLEGIDYLKPLFPAEEARYAVQVVLTGTEAAARFEISSRPLGSDGVPVEPWTRNVTGRIRRCEAPGATVCAPDRDQIRASCPEEVAGEEFYRLLSERGNEWGPMFQGVQRLFRGDGVAWSEITAPEGPGMDLHGYEFHPAQADAAGHVLVATAQLQAAQGRKGGAFVGGAIDEVRVYGRPRGRRLLAEARLRPQTDQSNLLVGDVRVFDEGGGLVSELQGARLWYLDNDAARLQRVDVGDRIFELAWRSIPLEGEPVPPSGIPVVVAEGSVARAFVSHMAKRGVECRAVDIGDGRVGERLEQTLSELGDRCGVVACHVSPTAAAGDADTVGNTGLGLASTVARACVRQPASAPARLWLATSGAQPVGAPPTNPLSAAIWGLGRSLALEHPESWGGLIDLDPEYTSEIAGARLAERVHMGAGEDQLACRGAATFVARLVASRGPEASLALRADASYLVTGGRGGLGLEVARSLAQRGARRIVLLGRSPVPRREDWAELTGHDDPQGRLVTTLLEIESLGAEIIPAAVDVSKREELQAWYGRFRSEARPPLRGVVHAAGLLRHRAVVEEDEDGFEAILAAKVRGGLLLEELLAGEPLDFFVLFSSASAILSSPRLGAYAAANAALDALAHYWRGRGRPALSINWGVWGEAGMVNQFAAGDVTALVQRGMGALTTAQGLEAFWRLVGRGIGQAAVLPVDWAEWSRRYPALAGAPFLREVATGAVPPRWRILRRTSRSATRSSRRGNRSGQTG